MYLVNKFPPMPWTSTSQNLEVCQAWTIFINGKCGTIGSWAQQHMHTSFHRSIPKSLTTKKGRKGIRHLAELKSHAMYVKTLAWEELKGSLNEHQPPLRIGSITSFSLRSASITSKASQWSFATWLSIILRVVLESYQFNLHRSTIME